MNSMYLSLQKKFFLAFFSIAVLLVAILAGLMHYVVRDSFGDYIARVKFQRLASVQALVLHVIDSQQDLSVLKTDGAWRNMVLAVEEVKRATRTKSKDQARISGVGGSRDNENTEVLAEAPATMLAPTSTETAAAAAAAVDNKSASSHSGVHDFDDPLPQYVRGVALLDADGGFVAGEPVPIETSLRFPIKDEHDKTVAFWLIHKGPPDSDVLGQHFLAEQAKWSFLLLAASGLLSIVLAWMLAGYFKKPLEVLQNGFRRVADGDLDTRLPVSQDNEMGEIQRNFNSMTAQLQAQESARRQWVADTSHELRTPLTILRMRNEAMRDGIIAVSDEEWQRNLSTISDLTVLINDLHAVARATEEGWALDIASIHIQAALEEAVQDNAAAFAASGLTLKLNKLYELPLYVSGDSQRLHQVLRNILMNSLRYTDTPGETLVEVSRDGKNVRIEMMDSAPAVPEAALPHLFERFYRVEASRNRATGGSGLGLAICESIVRAHKGKIWAENSRLGGLSIVVELPLCPPDKNNRN